MPPRHGSAARDGKRWLNLIADVFRRRPMTANVVGGAVMGGAGDAFCQLVVEEQTAIDTRRLGSMVLFGAGYVGGVCTLVYRTYVARTATRVSAFCCAPASHTPFG